MKGRIINIVIITGVTLLIHGGITAVIETEVAEAAAGKKNGRKKTVPKKGRFLFYQ
jgi:hypothetical protein